MTRVWHTPRNRGAARALLACLVFAAFAGCETVTSATEPYAPGDQPTARTRAPVATTDRDADRPDGVYWLVTYNSNNPNAAGLGQDLGLDQVGIRRDAIILYQWQLGVFPVEGPHRMLRDAAWLTRHLAKVRQDVAHWVRPGFTGVVVIDYESWDLTWDETLNMASPQAWDARDRD